MKKRVLVFALVIAVIINMIGVAPINVSAASPLALYVSPEGSDSGTGTISDPFATIEKAMETIRGLGTLPQGGVVVNLREGTYQIKKTINFTDKDSGTKESPIVYRSYGNEKAVISGSEPLCWKNWTELKDETAKKKIPADVQPKIKEMDLSKIETDLGELYHLSQDTGFQGNVWSELVFDGNVMELAKYPNGKDYLYVENVLNNGALPDVKSQWSTANPIMKSLVGEKDLWTMGWFIWHWTSIFEKVEVIDGDKGIIESAVPIKTHSTVKVAPDHPYYLVNAPQLIDAPNEYYIDRTNKKLYFYPPKAVEEIKVELTSLKGNIINMKNTGNIIFENLTIENGRAVGIEANNCNNITVNKCEVKNFAMNAINFWESVDCLIANSNIYNIGNRAVNMVGLKDEAKTLTPSNFRLINNEIHDLGRIHKTQATAVWIHGYNGGTVGTYIAHNKFYNMPFQVGGGGINSVFEYNEVFNCSNESADMGALYYGSGFGSINYKIRYNYIHDIPCNFKRSGYGTNGIYLDIDAWGYEVYGNVVENVYRNVYYASEGSFNKVYNNVFIGNPNSPSFEEMKEGTQTIRVAAYGAERTRQSVLDGLSKEYYNSDLWRKTFPLLVDFFNEPYPFKPSHLIERNVMYNTGKMVIAPEAMETSFTSIKNNWEGTTDPGFVDLKNGNYQLKPDAPVLSQIQGFEIIDMSKIGLLDKPFEVATPQASDEVENPNQSALNSKIKSAVVLQLDSPNALKNGQKVLVDSENPSVAPVVIDDRTLVPVRFISEAFGAKVGWKESTQEIAIVLGKQTIIMKLGSNIIKNGSEEKTMDVSAQTIQDRTFIPLRALVETLGKQVFWDDKGIIVISDTPNIFDSQKDGEQIDLLVDMTK